MRRGQVTIFATLGLVLLIIVGFALFLLREMPESEDSYMDYDEITLFVRGCADSLLDEGLEEVSLRGGYLYTPEPYASRGGFEVPFLETITPASTIEESIASYVEEKMEECFELSDFPGFNINSFSDFQVQTILGEDSLTATASFFYEDEGKEFSVSKNTDLEELRLVAEKIINLHHSEEGIKQGQLNYLQAQYNVYIGFDEITSIYYVERGDSVFGFAV
ncbi:hypothetical protein HQ533_05675 [Candidatus Woesearchaeota archaeon]|nr:hypothetical protein [Candidatus Woesearchaeota archaeon]